MSTPPSPDRRFIIALVAAVASATLAIGATTGALLGWIGPTTTAAEPGNPAPAGAGSSQIVYVPITPTAPAGLASSTTSEPRVAMAEPGSPPPDGRDDRDDRDDDRDHRHDRDHDEDDDD